MKARVFDATSSLAIALAAGVACATILGFAKAISDPVADKVKAVASAMLAYSQDFDGNLPLQGAKVDGKWTAGKYLRVSTQTGPEASIWANALLPYLTAGAATYTVDGPTFTVSGGQFPSAISYNGLLHGMGVSAVSSPALVSLAWTPFGVKNVSAAVTTPQLNCYSAADCGYSTPSFGLGGMMLMPSGLNVATEVPLYAVNLDLTLSRPVPEIANAGDWKQGIYVTLETPRSKGWPMCTKDSQGTTFPCYFRPDRSE